MDNPMLAAMVIIVISILKSAPKSNPKAIPGFSMNVMFRTLSMSVFF
jgi:hypothetical protein